VNSPPVVESRRPSIARLVGFVILLGAVAWGLGVFSAFPLPLSGSEDAVLTIAFKHVAAFEREAPAPSREELEKLPRHMRPQSPERSRVGKRVDSVLRVELDGRRLFEKTYRPSGLRHDGPTFAYEELALPAGRHRLAATLTEGSGEHSRRWRVDAEVEIGRRQVLLMEWSEEAGLTVQ
jgi:hypothetical protein